MKNLNIGWSLGFPQGFNTSSYKAVIEYAVNHQTGHFRLYEPWCKGWDNAKIVELISFLTWYGKADVLLCLSNAPYDWIEDYDLSTLTGQQQRATGFTNRFMPKTLQAYSDVIKDLVRRLKEKKLLDKVSFELGNEPDAPKFWWGTREEFIQLCKLKLDALKGSGRPIFVGDFTSRLIREGKPGWSEWIETDAIFDEVDFSHSLYWFDSTGTLFNPKNNCYPKRTFRNTVISEYNIYTSFIEGRPKDKVFNSSKYVNYFCDMLRYVHDLPSVSTVYIHTLCDYSQDEGGVLGHFKGKVPKPASQYFEKVWNVIKTNAQKLSEPAAQYELLPNGIKGPTQSIVFDENGAYTIVKNS